VTMQMYEHGSPGPEREVGYAANPHRRADVQTAFLQFS